MKKFLICVLMACGAVTLYAKDLKEFVVTTSPQMSCQNCENKIKGNLRFEKGVKKVETNLKDQLVTVTYDAEKTDESKLAEAFGKLNYKVKKVNVAPEAVKNCHKTKCDSQSAGCRKKTDADSSKGESCCKNRKN